MDGRAKVLLSKFEEEGRGLLVVRCSQGETDVYVLTDHIVDTRNVRVKFYTEPPHPQNWSKAESGDALFSPEAINLARKLLRSFEVGNTHLGGCAIKNSAAKAPRSRREKTYRQTVPKRRICAAADYRFLAISANATQMGWAKGTVMPTRHREIDGAKRNPWERCNEMEWPQNAGRLQKVRHLR